MKGLKESQNKNTIMHNVTENFKKGSYVPEKKKPPKKPPCFGKTRQPENSEIKYLHKKQAWQTADFFHNLKMGLNQVMNRQRKMICLQLNHLSVNPTKWSNTLNTVRGVFGTKCFGPKIP